MAFTVVQHTAGTKLTSSAGGLCVATAWGSNTAAGNLLLASICFRGAATVTCSTSGWIKVGTATAANNQTEIWYKENSAGTDASPVFTISASTLYMIHIAEISGAATSGSFDKTGTATGTTTATPSAASITNASQFVYGAGGISNSTSGSSWAVPSTASGSATFQADIDVLSSLVASSNGLIHSWALSGAGGTSPSMTFSLTGIGGGNNAMAALVATFNPPLITSKMTGISTITGLSTITF